MSSSILPALAERPAHVPADRVFDVDLFNLPGGGDGVYEAWKHIQDTLPDIFWTPRNGGYWMITRAKDIKAVQEDWRRFAMRGLLIPTGSRRPFPAPPLDVEPPEHAAWRLLISPAFSPRVVGRVEEVVRQTTIEIADRVAPIGECEFVKAFSSVLPIVVFLTMMNLPPDDRLILLPLADVIAQSSNPAEVYDARTQMMSYIAGHIEARKQHPKDDLITKIINAEIDGERISERNAVGICTLTLSGGLDTVRNMLSFIMMFLARNPGHVRQLLDDPSLVPNAVEELIRRHGISNSGRLVTEDFELLGMQIKAGDHLQAANVLHGLDERNTPDPMRVDFSRKQVQHAAFGSGPHICPGSILARREIKIMLEEWLPRIPEFGIKGGTKPIQGTGMVNFMQELWLAWMPRAG